MNFCEFDKYAVKSYCAIHNVDENLNLGDITKVDETKLKPFNMICGGSPCQDFSTAGKQAGSRWVCRHCTDSSDNPYEYNPLTVHYSVRGKCPNCGSEDIDKSRSSLLVEWLRIIRVNKPKWGIYENVKNIIGKKFKSTFDMFINELHEYGYNTYYKVLNAKDYGIPQNRERVYLIIIQKEFDNGKFVFPEPFDNGVRLKDILENEVDEKYYMSKDKVQRFLDNFVLPTENNKSTERQTSIIIQLGNWYQNPNRNNPQRGRVYDADGIAPALNTCQGGGLEPHIICNTVESEQCNNQITALLSHQGEFFNSETEYANTLLARDYKGFSNQNMNAVIKNKDANIRIRKLTPKEHFRLMGFSDINYESAKSVGVSNSQLYKQAGNSIVTDVLYYIFAELYKAMPYLFEDLKVSSYFSGIGAFEVALDRLYKSINTGNFYPTTDRLGSVCGDSELGLPAALKYQRTEYAKKIRKDYESGKIKERRCNMREYTLRTDGYCNTISTVLKDNYIMEWEMVKCKVYGDRQGEKGKEDEGYKHE